MNIWQIIGRLVPFVAPFKWLVIASLGLTLLGALAAPQRGELWTAERGRGSWRNGQRLQVSRRNELAGARVPAEQLPREDRDLAPVAKPNSIALRIALCGLARRMMFSASSSG